MPWHTNSFWGVRREHCDLSFRRGLGLEELLQAIFTAITLAFNKSSVSRVKYSALQRRGDAAPQRWDRSPRQGHGENSLQTRTVYPGHEPDPFMNNLGKGVRIVLIAWCKGIKKVLAFPLEVL